MRRSSMDLILLNSGIVAYVFEVCVWRVCLFQLGEVNDLGCVCIDGFRPNMDHPWQISKEDPSWRDTQLHQQADAWRTLQVKW